MSQHEPKQPKYQFRPEVLVEKMDECVKQALCHSYGAHLLQHTDAYLSGVGIGVIAMEEAAKPFLLLSLIRSERADPEIKKIQKLSSDHYSKLNLHHHLLENSLYITSAAAIISKRKINIDEAADRYVEKLEDLEPVSKATLKRG